MTDDQGKAPGKPDDCLVRRLVNEVDITEVQARELILFLGYDWPSLIREARILAKNLKAR